MGGADSGVDAGGSGARGGTGEGTGASGPLSALLALLESATGLLPTVAGRVGVVDLLTSPGSFVGDDNDRLTSCLVGVVDLGISDVEVVVGVADLLTSDIGETGSVEMYLLDSETVERGRVVVLCGVEV